MVTMITNFNVSNGNWNISHEPKELIGEVDHNNKNTTNVLRVDDDMRL